MTGKEKYQYWLMLVDYDMDTAKVLVDAKRWTYVVVVCQKAIERLIKGMHAYHTTKEAPKSHNISFLINKLFESDKFRANDGWERFAQEKPKYEDFLIDLMFYYTEDYPFSYKKVLERFIKEETALTIYEKTLDTINWLKSFQQEEQNTSIAN